MSEIELPSLEVLISLYLTLISYIGSFAMWGGVFSSMDCLLIYYRQKDDPWNAIAAGAITGGVLAIRGI
jgi:import inner membrane translocase subunit TIM17